MTRLIGGRPAYPFRPGDDATGQCSSCGLVFFGETAFDGHIRGERDGRGCIDPTNPPLRPNGIPESWWIDGRGRWHKGERMSDETRERISATRARSARSSAENSPAPVSGEGPADSGGSQTYKCGCGTCDQARRDALAAAGDWTQAIFRPFIVCPDCGNKRCPRATHHDSPCSGSNEPGQDGSWYA